MCQKVIAALVMLGLSLSTGLSVLKQQSVSYADSIPDWVLPGMQFIVKGHGVWEDSRAGTVGFPAHDAQGNHYFITSGYIFRTDDLRVHKVQDPVTHKGLEIYDSNDLRQPVGYEFLSFEPQPGTDNSYDFLDISLVKLYPGKVLHGSTVDHGKGGLGRRNIPYNISTPAVVGDSVCLAGRNRADRDCGSVRAVQENIPIKRTPFRYLNLVRASYCSGYGDSGGAVYTDAPAHQRALGIHVAHGVNNPCDSYYVTIQEAIKELRKHIPSLTIGN